MSTWSELDNARRLRLGGSIALTLLLLLAWAAWFRPPMLGGETAYIMVSGTSMEPTMYTGDLALVRKQDSYHHGETVAFRAEGSIVIHRIIGGDAEAGFTLQGDNRDGVDPWRPTNEHIVGEYWFHVPLAGHAFAFLQQPLMLALFAGAITFASLGLGRNRVPWLRRRQARRRGRAPGPGAFEPPPSPGRPLMFKPSRRALIATLGGCVVLTGAAVAVFFATGSTSTGGPGEPPSYEQRLAFAYEADTQVAAVYPDGRMAVSPETPAEQRQAIFTGLADRIHIDLDYAFSTDATSDVDGVLAARMVLRAPGAWDYELPVRLDSAFDGSSGEGRMSIDIADIEDVVATVEEETGYTARDYEIVVRAQAGVSGTLAGEPLEELHEAEIVFRYGPTHITSESELVHDITGTSPAALLAGESTVQEASFFGVVSAGDSPWRIAGGAGTLLGLMAVAAIATILVRDYRDAQPREIRSVNGQRVLQVAQRYGTAGTQRIVVASLDDLGAVAQREGEPVFHQRVEEGHVYFVPAGTVTYELRVPDADRPACRPKPQRAG